jgi:hypothetical protein
MKPAQPSGRPRGGTQTPPNKPGQYDRRDQAGRGPRNDREHEGATENEVADRTGPGPGYDKEPERVPDTGGVAES